MQLWQQPAITSTEHADCPDGNAAWMANLHCQPFTGVITASSDADAAATSTSSIRPITTTATSCCYGFAEFEPRKPRPLRTIPANVLRPSSSSTDATTATSSYATPHVHDKLDRGPDQHDQRRSKSRSTRDIRIRPGLQSPHKRRRSLLQQSRTHHQMRSSKGSSNAQIQRQRNDQVRHGGGGTKCHQDVQQNQLHENDAERPTRQGSDADHVPAGCRYLWPTIGSKQQRTDDCEWERTGASRSVIPLPPPPLSPLLHPPFHTLGASLSSKKYK